MNDSKSLIVLGMHRSGTSALAGLVDSLGIDFGSEHFLPDQDNQKGYFELREIVIAHKILLDSLGLIWDSVAPMPLDWQLTEATNTTSIQIAKLLTKYFAKSKIWGVKDPRMCRLLPLWSSVFRQLQSSPHILMIVRNPDEVAASMCKRDGFSAEKGILLWLRHVLEMEINSRQYPRAIITYDALLQDWKKTVGTAFATIGLEINLKTNSSEAEKFLDSRLRHQKASASEAPDSNIRKLASRAFSALAQCNTLTPDSASAQLNELAQELACIDEYYGSIIQELEAQIQEKSAKIEAFNQEKLNCDAKYAELAQMQMRIQDTEKLLDKVYNSRSWKLTQILRKLSSRT